MRTTALFIVSTLIILSFIGCNRVPSYDHRLVAVDSALAHDNPQEAKRLLDSIEDVSGEGNKAYYALLKSITNYRNYIDDTTDAVINEAVEYYQNHQSERSNYVRALIYKGCIDKLLGNTTDAIKHLKLAESECDTTDYFNMGYIKHRIAELYSGEYAFGHLSINKYFEAAKYYKKCNNMRLYYFCRMGAGGLYLRYNLDSAYLILSDVQKSYPIYKDLGCLYENEIHLANYYANFSNKDSTLKCRDYALDVVKNGKPHTNSYLCNYWASFAYAKLHQPDSALYYLNKLPNGNNSKLVSCKLFLQSQIEFLNHNYKTFYNLSFREHVMTDSIITNSVAAKLREIETMYDKSQAELESTKLRSEKHELLLGIICILLLAVGLVLWQRNKVIRSRAELDSIIAKYTCEKIKFDNLAKNNSELHDIASQHFQFFEQLLSTIDKFNSHPEKEMEKISRKCDEYVTNHLDDGFWRNLEMYVNSRYNNIGNYVRQNFLTIKDEDINFMNLVIVQYPTTLIIYLLKYSSAQVCYNKKRRLAARLGVSDLSEFIERFSNHN